MLKTFLEHHAERALNGERYNALKNCHVEGLSSVMLHDEPGNRIRMFHATTAHRLHKTANGPLQALALHPHHCDLRFQNVFGNAYNERWHVFEKPTGEFIEMDYVSGITSGGKGALTPTGRRAEGFVSVREQMARNPVMRAAELHTITLGANEEAAWLVFEGCEDPNYKPKCWTRNSEPDMNNLYIPMSQLELSQTFKAVMYYLQTP